MSETIPLEQGILIIIPFTHLPSNDIPVSLDAQMLLDGHGIETTIHIIHSLCPGTVWFPPDRCISREKARLQRSVLGNSNGEEILKIYGVSQRTPQMTSNNPNFQQSWNSSRVSQGWTMLKPISTMALFFKTRTTAFSPGTELHISKTGTCET